MAFRFRQSFRLWKGGSISWSTPLSSRSKRGGTSSGCGCLALGMLGVIALVGFLGKNDSSAESEAALEVEAKNDSDHLPLPSTTSEASKADESVQSSLASDTPPPKEFGLHQVEAQALFSRLKLVEKGFTSARHHGVEGDFWTWRKTDPDRQYSAVFLLNVNGTTRAITLELVDTSGRVDELARSFFRTVMTEILSLVGKAEFDATALSKLEQDKFLNLPGLQLYLTQTGQSHRRLTIQPSTTTS